MRPGVFSSDHDELYCKLIVNVRRNPVVNRVTALNYKRGDFDRLRSFALLPWNVMNDMDMDDAVTLF